jgi:hypothetical protein
MTHGNRFVHGDSRTSLHNRWWGMLERCENPASHAFHNYGGRGVRVCYEWHDYPAFRNWALATGYRAGLSIDRIDNDGDYTPKNCRWATSKQQAYNRRTNHYLTYAGISLTVTQWGEATGFGRSVIKERLRAGWPISRILTEPVRKRSMRKPE